MIIIICSYLSPLFIFSVVRSPDVKRNIMHLTHRMVKMFCGNLDMQDNPNFPNLTRMNNNGVKLSIRVNHTGPNEPKGTIIGAAICFRVPLSPQIVFDNLIDNNKRAKVQSLKFIYMYSICY